MRIITRGNADHAQVKALSIAAEKALGEFARLNPFWADRSYADIQWHGNEYRAYLRYTSDQGISTWKVLHGLEECK